MKRIRNSEDAPGHDSFLDIVANLVGILIILVMVVGVGAKDALVRGVVQDEDQGPDPEEAVEDAREAADSVEANINRDLALKHQRQQLEIERRRLERDRLGVVVAAAERALNERRAQLDQEDRAVFDSSRELAAARTELLRLQRTKQVVQSAIAPPAVVEHIPTPLARTEFGVEAHFRLKNGRLVHVPIKQLEAALVADARQRLSRGGAQSAGGVVGPIGGFRLSYKLRLAQYVRDNGFGATRVSGVELDHYVLQPVSEELGEPFENAFAAGSQFNGILSRLDPKTTITVWVYPDGFGQFRKLREELGRRGFLAASRPMPDDQPIGGSPQGARTVVQ